jgi:glycosyltransferase involved in cell wall biosynthesis
MREFSARGVPVLFRGDSHLLDTPNPSGLRWLVKRTVLTWIYAWPAAFLYVGRANRAYYEAFGAGADRLFHCPHSIDVPRFAAHGDDLESQARQWRAELDIGDDRVVLLFAGKFEPKKRPIELMRAIQSMADPRFVLVMVGNGVLEDEVNRLAASSPSTFRVLPFQNQQRMPVVYRLADLLILPSAFGETWGLAVNEAMACSRPVLASDRVGCAADVIDASCGRVFPFDDLAAMTSALEQMAANREELAQMGRAAALRAPMFDIGVTESSLMECIRAVVKP